MPNTAQGNAAAAKRKLKSTKKVGTWKRMLASLYNQYAMQLAAKRKKQGRALPIIWWQPVHERLARERRDAWPGAVQPKNETTLLKRTKKELGKKMQLGVVQKTTTTEYNPPVLRLRGASRSVALTTESTSGSTEGGYGKEHEEMPEIQETKSVSNQ
ncbi:unnamed protein product [Gongylonema pulchrum]|uniref:DUF5872 domain-containing protein n=1 Tax=Gongylonema pulchrum TaxID=637853 RepID=A0A183ES16_9BILA|nr:unnamed protein product [Gongylonema pulchrum]